MLHEHVYLRSSFHASLFSLLETSDRDSQHILYPHNLQLRFKSSPLSKFDFDCNHWNPLKGLPNSLRVRPIIVKGLVITCSSSAFPRYLISVILRPFLKAAGRDSACFTRGYPHYGLVGADPLYENVVALICKTCDEMKGCIVLGTRSI